MTKIIHFTNCLLADKGILRREDLYVNVNDGTIIGKPSSENNIEIIDVEGNIISPGFIDIQINGCFGLDYSTTFDLKNEREEFMSQYEESMKKLVQHGVTSICPTITSSLGNVYKDSLPILGQKTRNKYKTDSLGVHAEGPFISLQKKGCHPVPALNSIINGYTSLEERYGKNFEQYTSILTAAPELEGCVEVIRQITQRNIVFSIGHTTANFDIGIEAIQEGATMLTHLYNAMLGTSARDPGIVGLINTPLDILPTEKIPYYGLVADGIHVHPSMIKAAYNANPDKAILVTDAMYLIGMVDGVYERGSQLLEKRGKFIHLKGTETIAGSATHLLDCVLHLMKWTGIPLEKALTTVTNNPAKSLSIECNKGYLNLGCDADINILNSRGELISVYKLGHRIK